MKHFLAQYGSMITGVLSGLDRVVFRGTLRGIAYLDGMLRCLAVRRILLKNFAAFASAATESLKTATKARTERLNRPWIYLASSETSKEEVAREIAEKDKVEKGLIATLTCVEPCQSFDIFRDRETHKIELVVRQRKCLYFYHYMIDPVFGFMHARIQTWLPFNIQICINGREWLAREMDKAGIGYERRDNCFARVDDVKSAQDLLNRQVRASWPSALGRIAAILNPVLTDVFQPFNVNYYFSTYQSEFATDVMFRNAASLSSVAPVLMRYAMTTFSSGDVMRFLGRSLRGGFEGEIVSDFKDRPEGVRVKHRVGMNSVKLYDKQACVLRAETTLSEPKGFRVFRTPEGQPDVAPKMMDLRKGIADFYHWARISQASNERYLEALAAAEVSTRLGALLQQHTSSVTWKGKKIRGLRPWDAQDVALMKAINRGEFTISGFRNTDLQKLLFKGEARSKKEARRRSSRITRFIRMLRAHRIVRKLPHSHRYQVTREGHTYAGAVIGAQDTTLQQIARKTA